MLPVFYFVNAPWDLWFHGIEDRDRVHHLLGEVVPGDDDFDPDELPDLTPAVVRAINTRFAIEAVYEKTGKRPAFAVFPADPAEEEM